MDEDQEAWAAEAFASGFQTSQVGFRLLVQPDADVFFFITSLS